MSAGVSQNAERPVLQPGPDHPITVTPAQSRIVVKAGDQVIAESTSALTLRESTYPPAYYIPAADLTAELTGPTSTTSYCPYKGDCSYFTLATQDGEIADVAWSYQRPYQAVAEIAGYLAFYPNKVSITVD
ncbi:MAG TPA: DUF427 domain-containing protein [Streptosporangiaceae bacterium]|nr:DUF427 domain-containing protein [Streptosporangiaceae bacterium]